MWYKKLNFTQLTLILFWSYLSMLSSSLCLNRKWRYFNRTWMTRRKWTLVSLDFRLWDITSLTLSWNAAYFRSNYILRANWRTVYDWLAKYGVFISFFVNTLQSWTLRVDSVLIVIVFTLAFRLPSCVFSQYSNVTS